MNVKRLCEKSGYEGTVQRLIENKPFVMGMMRESLNNQMLELICQMEICRLEHGYYERYCHASKHCIGVPFCSKKTADYGEVRKKW